MLENEIANAPDESTALARGEAAPRAGFERATRGRNGAVDVLFVAGRDPGDDQGVRGIKDIKRFVGYSGHPLASDQILFGLG